jgi:hypothetical protein
MRTDRDASQVLVALGTGNLDQVQSLMQGRDPAELFALVASLSEPGGDGAPAPGRHRAQPEADPYPAGWWPPPAAAAC